MKNPILLLLLVIPFISSAQRNFRPGYIINLNGDTTSGFIDYKEWNVSPTSILFKAGDNAIAKDYGINDLGFFAISGIEAYRNSVVKISLHPANVNNIGARDTSWKIDTVFLKVVYTGKMVSLLSFTDKLKERFYILEHGQRQPTELIMREYLKEDGVSLIKETTYKSQLKSLLFGKAAQPEEVEKRIAEAGYDEADLRKIIALINGTGNEQQAEEKKVRRAFWFAGAGLQHDQIIFKGDHPMARNPNVSNSTWLPRVSAGVDLFANPNIGKVFYRIEAGYQVNQSMLTATLPDNVKAVYTLSASTVSLRAQVNYTLYNSDKLKTPVGVGVVYSHMSYSKNQYKKVYTGGDENSHVENWLDLRKSATTFFARASVVFNNKIEASIFYRPYTRLTRTVVYGMSTNNVQLQVYYLLRRK